MVTVTPLTMTGIFAPLAYDFLEFKRAQGYKYRCEEKVLRRFCQFSEHYPLSQPALTRELVSDWIAFREGEAKKEPDAPDYLRQPVWKIPQAAGLRGLRVSATETLEYR